MAPRILWDVPTSNKADFAATNEFELDLRTTMIQNQPLPMNGTNYGTCTCTCGTMCNQSTCNSTCNCTGTCSCSCAITCDEHTCLSTCSVQWGC